ncbi:hypothetical protein Bca4012_075085 [Brassica carinata]
MTCGYKKKLYISVNNTADTCCKSKEFTSLRCESDSYELIKAINTKEPIAELHGSLSDIHALVSSFIYVSFNWIPRDLNFVADKLAKDAMMLGEVFMTPT